MEVESRARTGLERFIDKFPYWSKNIQVQKEPEYLGVGAPMVDPTRLTNLKYIKGLDLNT